MVQEKNADELFPEFCVAYEGCGCVAGDEGPNEVLPADKSKAKDDGQTGMSFISLRSIVARLSFRRLSSYYTSPHHPLAHRLRPRPRRIQSR